MFRVSVLLTLHLPLAAYFRVSGCGYCLVILKENLQFGSKFTEHYSFLLTLFSIFLDINASVKTFRVNQPRAVDYSITHLAQCDGDRGVCPDQRVGGSNDVVLGNETSN